MLYLIIPSLSINVLSKNLSSKLNYLTKYHSCKKKNLSLSKCLTQKNVLSQKYPQPQKEPCGILQKNFQKKNHKKKFQKKIEERLPRFSRSQIGEGGYGLIHLRNGRYAPIHLHRHGDRHIDRHGDRERRAETEKFILFAYCLEFVGL